MSAASPVVSAPSPEAALGPVDLPPDGLLDKAAAAGLWGVGLSWMVPMLTGMTVLSQVVPPWRTDWLNRLYCRGQIALTGCSWSAVVHPDVDPDQPYVFCQNHVNHFDHVTLYDATPHFKQGVELAEHFDIPVYGWFMRGRGTIPVRRGSKGQTPEIMAHFRREVDRGHSILAFPEGTRTTTGRVGRFRTGIFHIARELGIPVVPVAITGNYEQMRKGSWLIRPGNDITVHVEQPISTEGLTADDVSHLADQVQQVVGDRVNGYWETR